MPEYDENFLLDCSNFEKQRWKSYNFKFKLKPLDTNSNYLPSPSNVKYSPLKGFDSSPCAVVVDAAPNGDYRHSVFGYPPGSVANATKNGDQTPTRTSKSLLKRKCQFINSFVAFQIPFPSEQEPTNQPFIH